MASNSSEVVFGLLHGSWHGSWCWDYLKEELDNEGYHSITPDFSKGTPFADFNVYRDEAVAELKDQAEDREVVLVAHSRAANVAPRMAGHIAIKQIIYLCGSFEPATLRPLTVGKLFPNIPEKYDRDFLAGIEEDEWGLTSYDPKRAAHYFFHDCPEDIQDMAVEQLSQQYKSGDEPLLETWPSDIPQTYIMGTQDRVIQPKWSEYITKRVLDIPLIKMDSGHSPFFSKPAELAKRVIQLAESK